jgi:hypothetical protein
MSKTVVNMTDAEFQSLMASTSKMVGRFIGGAKSKAGAYQLAALAVK